MLKMSSTLKSDLIISVVTRLSYMEGFFVVVFLNYLFQIKFSPVAKKLFLVTAVSAVSVIFLARHFKRRQRKQKGRERPWEPEHLLLEHTRRAASDKGAHGLHGEPAACVRARERDIAQSPGAHESWLTDPYYICTSPYTSKSIDVELIRINKLHRKIKWWRLERWPAAVETCSGRGTEFHPQHPMWQHGEIGHAWPLGTALTGA